MYSLNIIAQAIFSLGTPTALLFGVGWLLVSRAGAPTWIYAILLPLGILTGLVSMVKGVISATSALERLEGQNDDERGGR